MLNILVCYHANCTDGFFAAANFAKSLDSTQYVASYMPVNYGITAASILAKHPDVEAIYFVDFCPQDKTELTALLNNSDIKDVIVLDHHESTKLLLVDFPVEQYPHFTVILTDNLSGAGLVGALGKSINVLINKQPIDSGRLATISVDGVDVLTNTSHAYSITKSTLDRLTKAVNARDLWLKDRDMETGLCFDAYAKQHKLYTLATPETIYEVIDAYGGVDKIISEGQVIFRTILSLCQTAVDNSKKTILDIAGRPIRVVIGLAPYEYGSTFGDIGYSIDEMPTVVCGVSYNVAAGQIGLSIRSNDGCVIRQLASDVFGGGGHDHAAGAKLTTSDLDIMKIHDSIVDYIVNNPANVFV